MTFDMRSRRFWNKSDTSWKYPAKIFVRRSIFHRNTIYRSVIIEVNWSPQIAAHKEDVCASRKTHRQTVSASAVNLLRQKRKKRTLAETLLLRATSDTSSEYYGQEFGSSRKEGNETDQSMRSVKMTSAVTQDGDCLYSASHAAWNIKYFGVCTVTVSIWYVQMIILKLYQSMPWLRSCI